MTLLRFILSFVSLTLYSLPIVVFDASLFTLCSALQFTYPLWLSSSTWLLPPFVTYYHLPYPLWRVTVHLPFVTCHHLPYHLRRITVHLTLSDALPFTLPLWRITVHLTLCGVLPFTLPFRTCRLLRYRLGRVIVHLTFCDMSPFTLPFVAWYRSRLTLCDVSPFTLPFVTCHRSLYPLWHDTILDALPFVTCHRSPDVSPFTSPFVACHRLPERLWRVAVYQVRSRLVPFHCLEWRAGSIMRKCIKWTALLPVYIYLHFRSMEVFGMGEQVNSCLSNTATRTKEHCEEHFACTQPPLSCLCICF